MPFHEFFSFGYSISRFLPRRLKSGLGKSQMIYLSLFFVHNEIENLMYENLEKEYLQMSSNKSWKEKYVFWH